MLLLSALAWADALAFDAPNLSSYADAEAMTNVVFNVGDSDDRLFRLSLELNATADNNVSVVFGTHAGDGARAHGAGWHCREPGLGLGP